MSACFSVSFIRPFLCLRTLSLNARRTATHTKATTATTMTGTRYEGLVDESEGKKKKQNSSLHSKMVKFACLYPLGASLDLRTQCLIQPVMKPLERN